MLRFVCDYVLRFCYVSFLQDMRLQTQTSSPSLSPGCLKGFFGKQCRKKCNCANRGRCHRIYGACLCDPGLYGRYCHLGTPLLWAACCPWAGCCTGRVTAAPSLSLQRVPSGRSASAALRSASVCSPTHSTATSGTAPAAASLATAVCTARPVSVLMGIPQLRPPETSVPPACID